MKFDGQSLEVILVGCDGTIRWPSFNWNVIATTERSPFDDLLRRFGICLIYMYVYIHIQNWFNYVYQLTACLGFAAEAQLFIEDLRNSLFCVWF